MRRPNVERAAIHDLREVARLVVALRDEPPEVVIERAVLLHDDDDVIDRDVRADRVLVPDRLRGPRAGFEGARLPERAERPIAARTREVRRDEPVGGSVVRIRDHVLTAARVDGHGMDPGVGPRPCFDDRRRPARARRVRATPRREGGDGDEREDAEERREENHLRSSRSRSARSGGQKHGETLTRVARPSKVSVALRLEGKAANALRAPCERTRASSDARALGRGTR